MPEKRIGFGVSKFAWFKMLKNSARNCKLKPSRTATRLNNEESTLYKRVAPKRAARHVTESPGRRQQERIGIEIPAGFLEPVRPQSHLPFEVGIPVGQVGNAAVSVPGLIEAKPRRNRKAAPRAEDAVPLPVADQLFDPPAGSPPENLAAAERQSIAEAAAELVQGGVRRPSPVQLQIIRIQDRRRIIRGGGGEDGGIDINHFRERVIGPERQSPLRALGQREAASMGAGGA